MDFSESRFDWTLEMEMEKKSFSGVEQQIVSLNELQRHTIYTVVHKRRTLLAECN